MPSETEIDNERALGSDELKHVIGEVDVIEIDGESVELPSNVAVAFNPGLLLIASNNFEDSPLKVGEKVSSIFYYNSAEEYFRHDFEGSAIITEFSQSVLRIEGSFITSESGIEG